MRAIVAAKSIIAAQVDVSVKERLVELTRHYEMSMSWVIVNLINNRYLSLFGKKATIENCNRNPDGSRTYAVTISLKDYQTILKTCPKQERISSNEYVESMLKMQLDKALEYYRGLPDETKATDKPRRFKGDMLNDQHPA